MSSAGVVGKRLQLGFIGSQSRSSDWITDTRVSASEIPFGAPVLLNPDNTVVLFGEDATDDRFVGFAVRIVKTQQSMFEEVGSYRNGEIVDFALRGSMIVRLKSGAGTPTAGGAVYVRVADSATAQAGDISAVADGTNTVRLTGVRFTTGIIDDDRVEITITERRI